MAVIFYSSSQSNPAPELTSLVWDKLLHACGYALLALLYARALSGEGFGFKATVVTAFLLTIAYGVSDELHQSFTPMRTMDAGDWLADSAGAGVGGILWALGWALGRPLLRRQ